MSSNAAGSVDVEFGAKTVSYSEGVKRVNAGLDSVARKYKAMGAAAVSSQQAASATIRVFEGNTTNNIRAVERFITTIPGVSAALKIAFPLVGGIAFASLIVDMGLKVRNFIKTVDEMPKTIQKGFESLTLSQKTANDELDVTNDKLQNSIDKLEKKPTDGLKRGMDQAKVSADHLAASISGASDKLNELLSKNHISGLQVLMGLMGTKSTAGVEGAAKSYDQQISTASNNYANNPTEENHQKMLNLIQSQKKEAAAALQSETAERDAPQSTFEKFMGFGTKHKTFRPNNSSVIYDESGVVNSDDQQLRNDAGTTKNQGLQKQQDADTDKKNAADLAKQQTEAAKTAATARVAAMQTALDAMKLQYNMSIKATYDFWELKKSTELAGGTAYNDIVKKQSELAVQAATQAHEKIRKAIAAATRSSGEDATTGPALINQSQRFMQQQAVKDGSEKTQGYIDNNRLSIDKAGNDARQKEAQITDASGKSMSRYAAAVQLANVHTQEFVATQTALQAILNARKADQAANPSQQNEHAVISAQTALDNAQTQRGLQVTNDANNITPPSTSLTTGFDDAINDFVTASRDGAGMMRDIVNNTLSGLNNQLVSAMTGGKTNFKQFGLGVTRNVAGAALQKGEGAIMSAFGGGKLGTKGNPMHVTMADGKLPGTSGGLLSGIGGKSGDSSDGSDPLHIKNFGSNISKFAGKIGGIASKLIGFLPHFANGGQIDGPAVVGEQGEEVWTPPEAGGKIIPNRDVSAAIGAGNGGNTSYTIDARGTDAVQVQARVKQAIAQSQQSSVRQSVTQTQQKSMRQPQRSR